MNHRRYLFAAVVSLVLVVAAAASAGEPDAKPINQLVQVQGKFVGITPTGKRHQSYIFEFHIDFQLNGPAAKIDKKDEKVRFELYNDFGGGDLLRKLGGENGNQVNVEKAVANLARTPRFELILWRTPARKANPAAGEIEINASLVHSPVAVRD